MNPKTERDYLQEHLDAKYQGCQSLDDLTTSFGEAAMEDPDRREKYDAAYEAFDRWLETGEEIPSELFGYVTWEARRFRLGVMYGDIPNPYTWLTDADELLTKELPPRTALLIDTRTGGEVLLASSINQLFAYRGLGKSIVINTILRPLLTGRDWLHFHSPGGLKVVLVDGELPQQQLQERLREFSGKEFGGRLKIISPELMRKPELFPVLSIPAQQERFLQQIEDFAPDVIVFDTLTSIFRFDTNDTDAWTTVNAFLKKLRWAGYCVILVHHAGKNNTQRGRTDGDDNLDVAIQLNPRRGWQPGDGLQFEWQYEKVRHGAHLVGFEAGYDSQTRSWSVLDDDRAAEVMTLVNEGKTERQIAEVVGFSQKTVNRIKQKAARLAKLNAESVTQE